MLLERLALQRISPTVKGLLSPDQAGFRKGRSTCDQVVALTSHQFHRKWIPAEPKEWRHLSGLNSSI